MGKHSRTDDTAMNTPTNWTPEDAAELAELEAAFRHTGGRGVELAERIDELRAKRDGKPWPPEDEDD